MDLIDKNFKEIFSSEIFSIVGSLIAGTILALQTKQILLIPGMLLLLPGFLEMRGNISGTLSSRLSSGLFLGVIKPNKPNKNIIKGNVLASLALAFLVSFVLGVLVFVFNYYVFGIEYFSIIFLPIIAVIISSLIELPITIFLTFYLFKKGHDPNNIMGPFVTSAADITSVIGLIIGVILI